ncbi:MAG TPA: hypothetical protein DCO82_11425 [Alphaproteobacteria bacterium]|jgi:hypothetical protein|nr:hypothetical protein [Alphaproteobacteria bacterium]
MNILSRRPIRKLDAKIPDTYKSMKSRNFSECRVQAGSHDSGVGKKLPRQLYFPGYLCRLIRPAKNKSGNGPPCTAIPDI